MTRYPPHPYAFKLRRCTVARGAEGEVGFLTRSFLAPGGQPWSEEMASGIPKLNAGDSSVNSGRNVVYEGWNRLDRGGMGAEIANDQTRYESAAGIYAGDQRQLVVQPRTFAPTKVAGSIPAWEHVTAVLPGDAQSTLASAASTTVFDVQPADAADFNVGATVTIDRATVQHRRRILSRTGVTITIDAAIAGLAAGDVIMQFAQTIKQVLTWPIPATVPAALTAPAHVPVITQGVSLKSGGPSAAETWWFVFTKKSPWGESLRSSEASATMASSNTKELNIQFGSNSASETADGVTYAANTRDYAGVTGYVIYGHEGTSFDEDMLKKVAEVGVRSNQQVKTPKPRFSFKRDDLIEGAPPEYVAGTSSADESRIMMIASDLWDTFLYTMTFTSEISANIANLLLVSDVDESLPGRVQGMMEEDAACIWNGQLIVPTTNEEGTRGITRVWYDSSKGLHGSGYSLKWRSRELQGILGHRVYAESQRRMWRVYKNLAYWSSDPLGGDADWQGPYAVGSSEYTVKAIISYGGAKNSSDSAVYFTKADGLYRILDTSDGPQNRVEWICSFGVPHITYGWPLVEHRGELYIGCGTSIMRYTIASNDLIGPDRDHGLPSSLRGWCGGMASTGRHLYLGYGHDPLLATTGDVYLQILETEQGESWHQVHYAGGTAADVWETGFYVEDAGPMPTGESGYPPLLHIVPSSQTNDSGLTALIFTTGERMNLAVMPIRAGGERLYEAVGYHARNGGVLTLPLYYGGAQYVEKVWYWMSAAQDKKTVPAGGTGIKLEVQIHQPSIEQWDWTPISQNPHELTGEEQYWLRCGASWTDPPGVGRLYGDNNYRQEISGADRQRVIRSEGIRLRVRIEDDEDNTQPLVLNEIVLTYAEVSLALGRYQYSAELAMNQKLEGESTLERTTVEEFFADYDALIGFSSNSDPLILTKPDGEEKLVWMNLGRIFPEGWKAGFLANGTPFCLPMKYSFNVVFTELYNLNDTSRMPLEIT